MIFPRPQEQRITEGTYKLKKNYDGSLVDFYNEIKTENEDVIISKNSLFEKEEYSLSVKTDGISIVASCDEGIYRSATSLWRRTTTRCWVSTSRAVHSQRDLLVQRRYAMRCLTSNNQANSLSLILIRIHKPTTISLLLQIRYSLIQLVRWRGMD